MKTSLTALLVIISLPLFSQTRFIKIFGGSQHDIGMAVRQTSDGGYAVFGQTNSLGAGGRDMYLVKCDDHGEMIWQQTYGTQLFDLGISMEVTADDGFILVGVFNITGDSLALVKTDRDGNVQWQKQYSGSMATNVGRFVQPTADGGYIVIGFEGDFLEEDLQLLKVDADGNLQWMKQLQRPGRQYGTCIRQTADGGYIIVGETNHDTITRQDIYVVRTSGTGDTLWTRHLDTGGSEVGFSIDINAEGEYILVGHRFGEQGDMILIGLNDAGDEVLRKFYGSPYEDAAYSVGIAPDGYIIAGSKGVSGSEYHMAAIKTDTAGVVEWEYEYPLGISSDAASVDITSDGGFILLGSVFIVTDSTIQSDMYLVKVDSGGITRTVEVAEKIGMILYPNPVTNEAVVQLADPGLVIDRVEVFNSEGRLVDVHDVTPQAAVRIRAEHLHSGMYGVALYFEKKLLGVVRMVVIE